LILEQLFTGKIRLKLITRLFLNPNTRVFLRGLEREFAVSSNTVRLELAKLTEMHLIKEYQSEENSKIKAYGVNMEHPMFSSLRQIVLQYMGIDQILEHILAKLGEVEEVYLTGELAEGRNSHFVDLILVGEVDRNYLYQLLAKVESLIERKIRLALFKPIEFKPEHLEGVGTVLQLYGTK
jgi:predicted nucleotidyltransferase